MVGPGEFRALTENAPLMRPLVGRGFQVRELKNRASRNWILRRDWRPGVRLRPRAPGIHSQRIYVLDAIPPGIRRAGFREVMEVLRRPGQVGYPPSVVTDAQLGFSAMAY